MITDLRLSHCAASHVHYPFRCLVAWHSSCRLGSKASVTHPTDADRGAHYEQRPDMEGGF